MRNFSEEQLLYQEIPSIKPRVSRDERLGSRKNRGCVDCSSSMQRAKKNTRYLYWFYIAILGIGVAGTQYYSRFNKENYSPNQGKVIHKSLWKKISIIPIEQENRYGVSIILRNNGRKEWNLEELIISSSELPENIIYKIEKSILGKGFQSTFIPVPKTVKNLAGIKIEIKEQKK